MGFLFFIQCGMNVYIKEVNCWILILEGIFGVYMGFAFSSKNILYIYIYVMNFEVVPFSKIHRHKVIL